MGAPITFMRHETNITPTTIVSLIPSFSFFCLPGATPLVPLACLVRGFQAPQIFPCLVRASVHCFLSLLAFLLAPARLRIASSGGGGGVAGIRGGGEAKLGAPEVVDWRAQRPLEVPHVPLVALRASRRARQAEHEDTETEGGTEGEGGEVRA